MSWMKYDEFEAMRMAQRRLADEDRPTGPSSSAHPPRSPDRRTTTTSFPGLGLGGSPSNPSQHSSHQNSLSRFAQESAYPRRTLDQFYYPALVDTSTRDADQTISKWSGNGIGRIGKPAAQSDSVLIMVDQLWCWVIDKGWLYCGQKGVKSLIRCADTIITAFPSEEVNRGLPDFHDLYDSIRNILFNDWAKYRTVWDVHALIVNEAINYMFSQQNRSFEDLVEVYRWVGGKKVK